MLGDLSQCMRYGPLNGLGVAKIAAAQKRREYRGRPMTRLNSRVISLLLMAVRQTGIGTPSLVLSSIEESLTPAEYEALEGFLTWAFGDWDARCFGHGNIQERWCEYRRSLRGL